MTERKNVVVLGAGASKEFGLPTGVELAAQIATIANIRFDDFGHNLVSGDHNLVTTLKLVDERRGINPLLHAAWKIRDNMALAPSIDNYLDTHKHDSDIVAFGKIAICNAIQAAEGNSSLFVDTDTINPRLRTGELGDTWIQGLFKILVSKRDFEGFLAALRNITFISFNYDRCVQQYFSFAARSYFDLSSQGVQDVLSALHIVFPYGSVGDFEFVQDHRTNFGVKNYRASLLSAAEKIRTFTEGSDSETVNEIRIAFENAKVVMFLGFGFLDLNMQLLFQGERFPPSRVLATGKGMSENSRVQLRSELFEIFYDPNNFRRRRNEEQISVIDRTCSDLIFEFHRFLSGSVE